MNENNSNNSVVKKNKPRWQPHRFKRPKVAYEGIDPNKANLVNDNHQLNSNNADLKANNDNQARFNQLNPNHHANQKNSLKSRAFKKKKNNHGVKVHREFLGEKNYVESSRISNQPISGLDQKIDLVKSRKTQTLQTIPTKIYALGGIEEIGKNMYCIEHDDEIIIIDCGIKFANKKELPGILGIVPSFSYLKENVHKIKALVITHGHEDHIGGVPYLLKSVPIPLIYAPLIAAELIKRKASEHANAKIHDLQVFNANSVFRTKHFIIDFYRVNHSIPDSYGIAINTPNGLIATSGDFRFDFCSISDKTDLLKIAQIAQRGVDLLLCESTNAENPGFNESEDQVLKEINNLMLSAKGRIILTSFASNIARVEEVIKMGIKRNKRVVILGRSMSSNVALSMKIGYLKLNEQFLIPPKDVNNYPDQDVLILCTGSQGEENAALSTIARGKHAHISLKPSDTIIMASNAIPGNYLNVQRTVNQIYKSGAKVYINGPNLKIHSSGHGAKLEQQLLIDTFRPNYVVPIHGEYKMLRALQSSCGQIGIKKENVLIIPNGKVVELLNHHVYESHEFVDAAEVYVDGNDLTLQGNTIIKDRFELGENGAVFSQIYLDLKNHKIISNTHINIVGSFYTFESLDLIKKISYQLRLELEAALKRSDNIQLSFIKKLATKAIAALIWKYKRLKPVVLVEVSDQSIEALFADAIKLPKANKNSDGNLVDASESFSEPQKATN